MIKCILDPNELLSSLRCDQVLTILLEEAPSITLNLLIARCREIPISLYQLAKAGMTIFGALFR